MNEILKDKIFLKGICLFGAIYLFYRVGSFLVQMTRNLARYSKNARKKHNHPVHRLEYRCRVSRLIADHAMTHGNAKEVTETAFFATLPTIMSLLFHLHQ